MRTSCGLRTVVKILEVFSEVLGENFGKSPCYNTVENWIKKLGLSVYQDDQPCKGKKFAMVMDESIAINGQELTEDMNICISSDIVESTFGIYKSKKSANKLYGITPFTLMIPLYPKVVNESVTKTFNFKECLVSVKLKDIDARATEHLSKKWVTERTKTLKQVS